MPDHDSHRIHKVASVRVAILTISDTRTVQNDESGATIRHLLTAAGHIVSDHSIVPDEPDQVRNGVLDRCQRGDVDAILLTGGTGLARRDTTIEALSPIFEKRIDGFGELFRGLSYAEIGAAAMLSRAVAGTRGRVGIFALPGSTQAVRLAMEKLILPELPHLIALLHH